MIPQYRIKIVQNLNPQLLVAPSKQLINWDEELISNHEFVNPTGYTWEDFEEIVPLEEAAIQKAKESQTKDGFLETLINAEDESGYCTLADFGVAGTTIALVNLGYLPGKNGKLTYHCLPLTSYRGGERVVSSFRGENGFYPHVAGLASPSFGLKLLSWVNGRNIGLRNVAFSEGLGFELYAQHIEAMFEFGKFLYMQRE